MLQALWVYVAAAVAEIAGCFVFWAWLRLGRSAFWVAPGMVSLALFAFLLTRIDAAFAAHRSSTALALDGRGWPDRWDLIGAGIRLVGAAVILFGLRGAS